MRAKQPFNHDVYYKMALDRLHTNDNIFDYKHIVIPVMTKGRTYGFLSQEAVRRGYQIPDISTLGSAKAVKEKDGKIISYVAFWDDHNEYTHQLAYNATLNALLVLWSTSNFDYETPLCVPPLGPKENKLKDLVSMEVAVETAQDTMENSFGNYADVIYVTAHSIT